MASLYIKDAHTAELAAEVARRAGTTKTAAVRDALTAYRDTLPDDRASHDIHAWFEEFRGRYPLGELTGLKADKAFYDSLDENDGDV